MGRKGSEELEIGFPDVGNNESDTCRIAEMRKSAVLETSWRSITRLERCNKIFFVRRVPVENPELSIKTEDK